MRELDVLVISERTTTAAWLAGQLGAGLQVRTALPGPETIRAMRERTPDVAVLDGIDERPGLARLEVALLKDRSPGVRIIALSTESSAQDAEVVEQGVFCYLGGCSLQELLRAVVSAANGATHGSPDGKSNLRGVS